MSIRVRLALLFSAVMALVLLVLGTALYYTLNLTLNREVNHTMREAARIVATSARPRVYPQRGLVVNYFPQFDVFASPTIYLQAIDSQGRISQTSSNLGGKTLPPDPEAVAKAFEGYEVWRDLHTPAAHLRILSVPLMLGGVPVGVLQVGTSLNNIDRALNRLLTILTAGGIVAVGLSAALGFFLADKALQPINRITQTALEITRTDDLSRRIEQRGPQDEVGRLVTVLNEMLDRIERLFRTQQRFIADISHELRTPLTAIRGNLDLMRRMHIAARASADGQPDPQRESLEASLAAMQSEADRMARLINDLLLLAQADAGIQLQRELVEIDAIVRDVYQEGLALADGVELTLDPPECTVVLGDGDRLKQLLLNLVDNAIKYTPQGGQVHLSMQRSDGWVRIDVVDTGIGIPPEDLPHIFERFYRVDKARSRKRGGTGLGLSIARWIAEAHGGRIEVQSEVGRGSTFTVWLPEA